MPRRVAGSAMRTIDERLGDGVARWVTLVVRFPRLILVLSLLCVVAAILYAHPRLGLNSNEDALFSPDVEYAALRQGFREAFPALLDPIIVIIDAADGEAVSAVSDALRARLAARPELFPGVFDPTARVFFEGHGMLYLELDALYDHADRLASAQPVLAEWSRDPNVRGSARLAAQLLDARARGEAGAEVEPFLKALAESAASLHSETPTPLSAGALLGSEAREDTKRGYLLVQPVLDHSRLRPAEATLDALGEAIEALRQSPGLGFEAGTRVQVTGLYPLSYEEAHLVERQTRIAGLASLLLVGAVLAFALRSLRLVAWVLVTLLCGLVWSAAFAAFAVGHLNLVSVAFAVLFIGLSVDFGIHFVLRFDELRALGNGRPRALIETGRSVGASLLICSATTAIGFYAFVPTDFVGVAELGLIAGTAMWISLFANLTLLPALCALFGGEGPRQRPGRDRKRLWLSASPLPALLAGGLTVAAVPLLWHIDFDSNPLRVRDPDAPSVRAFDSLLAEGSAFPWNLNSLVDGRDETMRVAASLEVLPEVDKTLTLFDFIPDDQDEKMQVLGDSALLLLPVLEPPRIESPPSDGDTRQALRDLVRIANASEFASGKRLATALRDLLPEGARAERAALHALWVSPLEDELTRLGRALGAQRVSEAAFPEDLRVQRVARDGRFRIEVFPRENLSDNASLLAFVDAVQGVDPKSFGEGIVIAESGRIVVASFQKALFLASLAIALILILLWRNPIDPFLVAAPLAAAAILCAALTVVLGIPINYANVIVIPLLLGIGVDSGIHLVHRFRSSEGDEILRTSTARGVLFAALTTLSSFGTLAFSTHRGMASLGQLLVLGIIVILVCNLVVLPGLATWATRR